jgi:hypothetical protein
MFLVALYSFYMVQKNSHYFCVYWSMIVSWITVIFVGLENFCKYRILLGISDKQMQYPDLKN